MNGRKCRRGFTLIEVMAAVFVMALAAAFGATTIYLGQSARIRSSYLDKAAFLAQKELEKVKATGFVNLTPAQLLANGLIDSTTATATGNRTYPFTNTDSASYDSVAKVLPSGVGTLQLENNGTTLKNLYVVITWNDRGVTRSYSTATTVANL